MSYIVSNKTPNVEVRVSLEEIEGRTIYNGHVLAIPDNILDQILTYSYERYTNRYFFVDYVIWDEKYQMQPLTSQMTDCYFNHRDNLEGLRKSFDTLLKLLQSKFGKSRRIYIVEI